jgi:hypothetical protein
VVHVAGPADGVEPGLPVLQEDFPEEDALQDGYVPVIHSGSTSRIVYKARRCFIVLRPGNVFSACLMLVLM